MSNTNTKTNTNKNASPTISAVTASTAGPGGVTTGSQACAACKYQRRKCAPDCILAPYFPPNEQKQFLNAHKLFGVSNIVKVLNHVPPLERETAMKSLIFHANVRAYDPVGGCYRIISNLQHQIFESRTELEIVLRQLAVCRQTPNPSLVDPLCVYGPVNLQAMDNDLYGRSVSANPIQEQELFYDIDDTLGIKMNPEGSSSSMLMDTQHVFVESEDIKPLDGIWDEKESTKESNEFRFVLISRFYFHFIYMLNGTKKKN